MIVKRGEDVDCIIDLLTDRSFIAFEGHTGSGKTTAGIKVSKKLGAIIFDTDSYMCECDDNTQPFVDYHEGFNFELLNSHLSEALAHGIKVVLVGICLRKTLEQLDVSNPFFVYIKEISRSSGVWNESQNVEDFILGVELDPKPYGVHLSDYNYIKNYNPHEIADVIFERLERSDFQS
jgi:hypothetical protein